MNPNEMFEQEQIDYVKKYYKNIGNIDNPSEKIQMEAVKADLDSFFYIKNSNENVQKYVVSHSKIFLKIIIDNLNINPSKEVQKASIDNHYSSIKFIIDPDEEIQLYAVQKYLNAIYYIKNPTETVQIYVVKQNGFYIEKIIQNLGKNPSKKVQKAAIDNYWESIQYIIDPDEEIQMYAIQKNILTIEYIKKPKYKNFIKLVD